MKAFPIILLFFLGNLAFCGTYNYSSTDFINQGTAQVGRNYIKNGGGEVNKLGWSTFADAAATSPVDGTGGSPNSTWTRTTSSPLRGTGSFLWTKSSGASRQGEGVSYDFTIDTSDKGKVLQVGFDYAIASGTFVDDAMSVWIYDVTNATLIQPAPYLIKNHSLAAERLGLEFQASSSSTSFRLIIFVGVSTDSANTLKFDNFSVGPTAKLYGSPVTDWVAFTPTGAFTNNTTYTGFWRRVGDSIEVDFQMAFGGAPNSTTATVNLPSGYTIDTAKLSAAAAYRSNYGQAVLFRSSYYPMYVAYNNTTSIQFAYLVQATAVEAGVTQAAPATIQSGDYLTGRFKVPITGWSSSVIMSSDADTRATTLLRKTDASQTLNDGVFSWIEFEDASIDSHGAWRPAVGAYTAAAGTWATTQPGYVCPVTGKYQVDAAITVTLATSTSYYGEAFVYVDTVQKIGQLTSASTGSSVAATSFRVNGIVECNAGGVIQIKAYQVSGSARSLDSTSTKNYVAIHRISGPAQIAASETVAARYYVSASTANTSFADDTPEIVDADTKVFDTHGAVTVGAAWKFTVPVAGKYQVCIRQRWANGTNLADTDGFIYKNGASYAGVFGSPTASVFDHNGCATVSTIAGDYIQWYATQNDSAAGARNIATSGGNANIDIHRIGN